MVLFIIWVMIMWKLFELRLIAVNFCGWGDLLCIGIGLFRLFEWFDVVINC